VQTRGLSVFRVGALALLLACAPCIDGKSREDCEREYAPRAGQRGKDVVWVPTNDIMVTRMLEMAKVTADDLVFDLGAGDGKIAITAAQRYGAAAVGVEYNPDLVRLAKCLVDVAGVNDRVSIWHGDIFETDFSDATVVVLYLSPTLNVRLRPKLLSMAPGTRVVSNSFTMGEWKPDARILSREGRAYLWIVPARVAGTWRFTSSQGHSPFTVHLEQQFQELSGAAGTQGVRLSEATLTGSRIELTFRERGEKLRLTGHVEGDRIRATLTRNGISQPYVGTRVNEPAT
jgi:SAM-dependent methyltransferase